ncbi:putative spore germination protein YfkT [Paenibacillus marchantiophytorum]|uniref:Spore germination protein YfkT n=1 Tax=Paenibacillus marchantiophytorum TaxID=1619310 RepID=A0ABQ2BNV5_9BACL|nr:endospore germination permease [Paenibacillus marchantiophytorum]GGI43966.1 putative spore germination protein YfkT [Paenibacillus marchantiophytorum]
MNEMLSARQMMILVLLFMVGTTILVVPSALANEAKQNAWLLQVIGTGSGMFFLWLYMLIFKRNSEKSLYQMNEQFFGRWMGKGISMIIICTLLITCAQVLYYIGSFITTQIMPDTPLQAIHVLFIIAVMIGVNFGIANLARTAEIFFPWIILLFVVFILLIIPEIKPGQLLPINELKGMSLIRGALQVVDYSYLPLFITFAAFNSVVVWKPQIGKAYVYGGLLSGLMLMILVVVSTTVLGPANTETQIYPTYVLARKISVGNFLQRIEVIVAFLWFIFVYFKLTLYFYAMIVGFGQVFHLPNQGKVLIFPLGMIVTVLSLVVYPNFVYESKWDSSTWTAEALILGLVYPLILLMMSIWKNKKGA